MEEKNLGKAGTPPLKESECVQGSENMGKFSEKSLKRLIQKIIDEDRVIEQGELLTKANIETESTGNLKIFNKVLFSLQEEGEIKVIEPKIGDEKSDIVIMKTVQKEDLARFFSKTKMSDRGG